MPPLLSREDKNNRIEFRKRVRSLIRSADLSAADIGRQANTYLKACDDDRRIEESSIGHWVAAKGDNDKAPRVPQQGRLAHAVIYALDALGAWQSNPSQRKLDFSALPKLLGFGPFVPQEDNDSMAVTLSGDANTALDPKERSPGKLATELRSMDTRSVQLSEYLQGKSELRYDVDRLFGSMAGGDVYVYCAFDLTPYEMDIGRDRCKYLIKNAINTGCFFVYLYPSQKVIESFFFRAGIAVKDSEELIRKRNSDFKRLIERVGVDSQVLKHKLHFIKCKSLAYMVPQHKYILFRCRSGAEDNHCTRALAVFPVGSESRGGDVHAAVHARATSPFKAFVSKTVHEYVSDNKRTNTDLVTQGFRDAFELGEATE